MANYDKWLRPSKTFTPDSAAYAANDSIGGALAFDVQGGSTGGGLLQKIVVITDEAINGAGALWIFNDVLVTPILDNAPFGYVLADYPKLLTVVTLNAFVTVGANNSSITPDINDEIFWTGGALSCYYVPSGAPDWGTSKNIYMRLDILTQ